MQPSSEFCRLQETRQRALAQDAVLENSRKIATVAANAWATAGDLAAKREARGGKLDAADEAIAEEFRLEGEMGVEVDDSMDDGARNFT